MHIYQYILQRRLIYFTAILKAGRFLTNLFLSSLRYTTLSYRAPEMVNLYNNKIITTKADIWVSEEDDCSKIFNYSVFCETNTYCAEQLVFQ